MANPQESKHLKVQAITSETVFRNFEEIAILDDTAGGYTITDSDGNAIVSTGGSPQVHIGGPGKPVDYVKITPASGKTINILLYQ